MELNDIKQSIRAWSTTRKSKTSSTYLLCQGSSFDIDGEKLMRIPVDIQSDKLQHIHAYPAVKNGKLYCILINNIMDTPLQFKFIEKYPQDYISVVEVKDLDLSAFTPFITTKKATKFKSMNAVDPKVAIERILRWSLLRNTWVQHSVNSTLGLLQAFVIPIIDIKKNRTITAFFALEHLEKSKDSYPQIEVILWDKEKFHLSNHQTVVDNFFDVSRPVPPFGGNESNFNLLNISQLIENVTN